MKDRSSENKAITKTYLSGHSSCTIVIPKAIASKYSLDSPSHVIIESRSEGILIKKLEI